MPHRKEYEEHSEREQLSASLAAYHFEQTTIPLHWHREIEFILPEQGGELELEWELRPYAPGELLCVNTEKLHRTRQAIPRADLLVVDLQALLSPLLRQEEGSFLNKLVDGSLTFPLQVGKCQPGYKELKSSFDSCVHLLQEKPQGWEVPLQMELLRLLRAYHSYGLLIETETRPYNPQIAAVKGSIALMRQSYGQELTLEGLAHQAILSPSHYIRVFRHYTGQTPIAFLTDLRMEEASCLLRQSMTVSETAIRVGVPNLSHFIRLFRRHFGQTPKQYQKSRAQQI